MKKFTILSSITLAIFLLGCNSSSTKTTEAGTQEETISIPKEISMKVPKSLSANGQKSLRKVEKVGVKSFAYEMLKNNILMLEDMKKEIESNLIIAQQLMPKIQKKCQNIAQGTPCTIAEKELVLEFNETLVKELIALTGDNGIASIQGTTLELGKVEFTQFSETENYQYALKVSIPPLKSNPEVSIIEDSQSIKWSKDEKHILSQYNYEDTNYHDEMTMNYTKETTGKKHLTQAYKGKDKTTNTLNNFSFSIEKELEAIEKYKISSQNQSSGNGASDSFSSIGEISDKGGYLTSGGTFDNSTFKEKEIFDAQGVLLSNSYCNESASCDLNDESTWLVEGNETLGIEDDFNPEVPEDLQDINNLENGDFYFDLTMEGGNLESGQYFFLEPTLDIAQMNELEVMSKVLGELFITDNIAQATLRNKSDSERFNSLIIVQTVFPENIIEEEISFKIIEAQNRPLFTIKETL